VHAGHLLDRSRKSLELIATCAADQPLSVQVFGADPGIVARAARWLEAEGYGGVDINMGCPMSKVNTSGGGARLLCDLDAARRLVVAVVETVSIPVSVKMRLGWDADNITAPRLARELERLGVSAVTVHGRTRQQGFHGRVDLEGIRATVEAVEHIPVIGNGDVRCVQDALHMRRTTGCAAVAIGRGAMLDPWIFRKIAQAGSGCGSPAEPTPDERIDFLVRHFLLMADQHGDRACLLFRKFAGWYGARLGIPEDLEDRLRRLKSTGEFDQIVERIRRRQGERRSQTPTALIKVPNGPVERW